MTIVTQGAVAHRTKVMEAAKAERFARCLAANSRFVGVEVVESPRSKGKFFVAFQPSNEQRQEALVDSYSDARAQRAAAEGEDYLWVEDRGFHWCHNPKSGETYEVHHHGCSCPDHQFRASRLGIDCKHVAALRMRRGTFTVW